MMQCKVCQQENSLTFKARILNKYDVKYYHCLKCGFLQTEEPYWLKESYMESINISDTGIMARNISFSKFTTLLIFFFFDRNKKFLDFAGGYGIFARLMRDIGFDFYWNDKYSKNLVARGFEYDESQKIELLTSFESFEHFVEPINEIESMLKLSKNIFFSTELLPSSIPKPDEWWYYGLDHGQHISFYSESTFQYIAKKYGLNYVHYNGLHLLTDKQISNFKLQILKFVKLGLHKLCQKRLQSKTWGDHLKMSEPR